MKEFYGQIRVDTERLRFYTSCPICGRLYYGRKLPLLCRNVRGLSRCEAGKGNALSQSVFNHTKANATRQLSLQFNQCRHCFRLVCDACYDSADAIGACLDCAAKK